MLWDREDVRGAEGETVATGPSAHRFSAENLQGRAVRNVHSGRDPLGTANQRMSSYRFGRLSSTQPHGPGFFRLRFFGEHVSTTGGRLKDTIREHFCTLLVPICVSAI